MASAQFGAFIRCVRNVAAAQHANDQPDEDLLGAFLAQKDQASFTAVVKRHGPLVMGVCRRVLHHLQDAEDAFQATFLLLALKAASIRKRESLSSWLHGAAYRMAMHAKRTALRRRKHEEQASLKAPPSPAGDVVWREVQAILDEEIACLPELYRQPFILCCLENKGRSEVARQLGLKEATVWSRLAHARRLLQQRLERRGVSLAAVLGTLALSENTARAVVSSSLVSSTVKAALAFGAGNAQAAGVVSAQVAALVKGGLKIMFVNKLKIATAVLLGVGICGFSATVLTYGVLASQQGDANQYPTKTSSLNPREKEASPLNQQDKDDPEKRKIIVLVGGTRTLETKAKKIIDRAENVNERVLEVRGVPDRPDTVLLLGKEAGTTRLILTAKDGTTETFEVIVQLAKEAELKLKRLLKDRVDAAKAEIDARMKEFEAAKGTLDFLCGASKRLLLAELDASEKKAVQLAALQAHLDRMKKVEDIDQRRYDAGRISIADLSQSKYYRLEAEIWLERGKTGNLRLDFQMRQ